MPYIGLFEALTQRKLIFDNFNTTSKTLKLLNDEIFYYSPGFMVLLAAYSKSVGVVEDGIIYPAELYKKYAEAINLPKAVWNNDTYKKKRINEGRSYSSLIHLNDENATDKATEAINGCIRSFFRAGEYSDFVKELCDLIGDLHSNVWAHGKSSGFSMAQKNKVPNTDYYCLEFALADSGMGFLGELQRVGSCINNHKDAIEWCVQEGNSTKKSKLSDEWAQTVPDDIISNPLRGIEATKRADNSHHMGLGLFKLIEVITKFRGELKIATGDTIYILDSNGKKTYKNAIYKWKGVAISCKFSTRYIDNSFEPTVESGVQNVYELLRRN